MSGEQLQIKYIKICVLGSEKVGKSYLARKLVGRDYIQLMPKLQRQRLVKQISEYQALMYHDYPPMQSNLIDDLPKSQELYHVMIFLFKDSVSFGQLYEFFQEISKKTDENVQQFNNYWENIKHMVLVYSDYLEQKEVQTDQLFSILSQEIRNFNRTGNIHKFVLRRESQNHEYLKQLIEQRILQRIEKAQEQEKIQQDEALLPHEEVHQHLQEAERSVPKVEEEQVKDVVLQQPQGKEQEEQHFIRQEQNKKSISPIEIENQIKVLEVQVDKKEIIQVHTHQQREQVNAQQPQEVEETKEIVQIKQYVLANEPLEQKQAEQAKIQQTKIEQTKEVIVQGNQFQEQLKQSEQLQESLIQNKNLTTQTKEAVEQINRVEQKVQRQKQIFQEKTEIAAQLQQKPSKKYEQNQHYQQVYNRLIEKISSKELTIQKKESYQDLFEEFRRTSNESGTASKQLCQYWQQKVKKLEQEEGQVSEEEQSEQKQQQESQLQLKTHKHPHNLSSDPIAHPHGDLLQPHSNYLDGGKPKKQKKQIETKPCMCEIM